jgi:hypothetical protein
MKKAIKGLLIFVCVVGVLLALPFVALRIAITPAVRTELLELVPDYMDAEVEVADMDYSLLSTWPHVSVMLKGVVIYTHVAQPKDTLLCADSLYAQVNAGEFLSNGNVRITSLYLEHPKVFAQTYSHANNWDIFPPSEPDTTTSSPLPPIYVDTLKLANGSVYYQNDTANYNAALHNFNLVGYACYTPSLLKGDIQLNIDSLTYQEIPANAHYAVNQLSIFASTQMQADSMLLKTELWAPQVNMNDSLLGIVGKPLGVDLHMVVDTTFSKFAVKQAAITFDETQLFAAGIAQINSDSLYYLDANARLKSPKLEKLLTVMPKNLTPYFKGIRFSGGADLQAAAKGFYGNKQLPTVQVTVALNNLKGSAAGRKEKIDRLQLNAKAAYHPNSKDSTYLKIENFIFKSGQSHLNLQADATYKQKREHWDLRLKGHLNLKELNQLYPFYERSRVRGLLDADINAQFFLSDLIEKKIYNIHSQSTLTVDDVFVNIPTARTRLLVDSLRASLYTNTGVKFGRRAARIDTSLVNARIAFSNMSIRHKRKVRANADRLSASFLADDLSGNRAPRLRVSLACKGFDGVANDTLLFKAKRAMASTSVMPNKEHTFVPTGAVRLYFDSVLWSSPKAGMVLDSTLVTFDATPRYKTHKRVGKGRLVKIPDAEQQAINLDSLYKIGMQVANSDDFSETYLNKFSNNGKIYLKSFRLRDPKFPLRTSLNRVDVHFNDDTLHLDNMRLRIGRSNVRLSGRVDNMRRYLLRGQTLKADLKLTSRRLDLNQLLRAANSAMNSMPADSVMAQQNALLAESDTLGLYEETQDMAVDSLSGAALVVLPRNLNVRFNAKVDSVFFSKMKLADFTGNVRIKNQVMSIGNLSTSTQVGKAAMHVSYECKKPNKADVALAMDMDSVQIGSLVHAMPELDAVMPMLRSFDGSVACEVSASAQLDSAMNIKLPTVNAGAWLRGDSLVLMDGETFSEIAKMLMFNKKTKNLIDSVSVELVVKNNEIEIYPFMVSMDKYRLGVGGTQGLDLSFNYHVALLKPVRLGLDVYGKDFDHIKFRLASTKFKDGKTVIGKGGYLIREEDVNVRKLFHDKVIQDILKDNR